MQPSVDMAGSLLALVFPPRCGNCDARLPALSPLGLCVPCYETLEPNDAARCPVCDVPSDGRECLRCRRDQPSFEAVRAPWIYGGALATLIWRAKFRHCPELASVLGRLLVAGLEREGDGPLPPSPPNGRCVVPVPLSRQRLRERGYNQAGLIASAVARHWGLPVCHSLRRVRATRAQSELSAWERQGNIDRAFRASEPLRGEVILVDDVITSTETVRQASAALVAGGAAVVYPLAVARAVAVGSS